MRVLVVAAPLLGHLFPMVPLASALQDAGHDVRVATAGDAASGPDIGLPVENVAASLDFGRIARATMLRHPRVAIAELKGEAGTAGVSLLFGAVNAELAAGLLPLVDRWEPDLVVHEPLAIAGLLAASRRGIPAVLLENSLYDGPALIAATAARMTKTMHSCGISRLDDQAAVLTMAPPSLVGARMGWPLRATPYSTDGDVPDWLTRPSERPRILVSRSTVQAPGRDRLMSSVVDAAPDVDAEFVLVRPDQRVSSRDQLPDNVRTVGWVPIPRALATCAGLVHHGGAGTIFAGLAAGVPQLLTPGPGDRKFNTGLVAARGAGLAVGAKDISAAHLTRLVSDRELATAAHAVREEISAMPEPRAVAERLAALLS